MQLRLDLTFHLYYLFFIFIFLTFPPTLKSVLLFLYYRVLFIIHLTHFVGQLFLIELYDGLILLFVPIALF